jgi:hypothetical protein
MPPVYKYESETQETERDRAEQEDNILDHLYYQVANFIIRNYMIRNIN